MKLFCALFMIVAFVSTHYEGHMGLGGPVRVRLVPRDSERQVLP